MMSWFIFLIIYLVFQAESRRGKSTPKGQNLRDHHGSRKEENIYGPNGKSRFHTTPITPSYAEPKAEVRSPIIHQETKRTPLLIANDVSKNIFPEFDSRFGGNEIHTVTPQPPVIGSLNTVREVETDKVELYNLNSREKFLPETRKKLHGE